MTIRRMALPLAFVWAFLAVYTVHFLHFRGSVPDFEQVTNGGKLLDVAPSFTVPGVYERLEGYGDEGRRNYAFRNVTVDVALPLSLLPFLWLFMRAATAWIPSRGLRIALLAIPVTYVVFDLVENAAVLTLLRSYPSRMDLLAAALPYVTMVKRVASLLAVFGPLILLALRWLRRRKPLIAGA
jgi:hypothetical protein